MDGWADGRVAQVGSGGLLLNRAMVQHFRDLRVYREAFLAAREIYRLSKTWPTEERYALTDQIRRSSRSVATNIAEAWRKRRYPNHFVSKLSDGDAEAAETQSWLDFAVDYGYITHETYTDLDDRYDKIQGSLVSMMTNKNRWCGPSQVRETDAGYDDETTRLPWSAGRP
jgi:four helix bundle protein